MLWDYSPSTNNHHKVQFLLPVYDEPKVLKENFALAETKTMAAEAQQVLQKLFSEFLGQMGYSVSNTDIGAANNANALPVEDMLGMMQSFAFCASLRDHSMRPLLMLNTLIANVYAVTEAHM